MNTIIEHLTGMHTITDQVIAMDFLNVAKSGVRNYAMAATEAGTPEIKAVLIRQLDEAIDMHESIVTYMIGRNWYHPWNLEEQYKFDLQSIETALNAPNL